MKQSISIGLACGIILYGLATTYPIQAQILPDPTLPNNSSVTSEDNVSIINEGTRAGSNLFHSFEQFSIPTGSSAYFNNTLDIQNIISRVTGTSISNIDGLIQANGTANLFLLNPNGIIFGPNSSLNIGGSFVGTTASSINFADGTQFASNAPQTTPLLTVSVPLGLQFGSNPGRILVQGQGKGIRTTADLIDTSVGLRVQPNATLALIGGDVALEGGTLKTAGGRIELGSVAGPISVRLTPVDKGWALGYEGVQNLQDIQLSQQTAVDASGLGGGDVQVWGRRVTLTNGSQIEASTIGSGPGGTLAVTTSEAVELIEESGLFSSVYPGATGAGGNLTLETEKLSVRNGAQIGAVTFGRGSAGTLAINAKDSVELSGTSTDGQFPSSLSTSAQSGATGAGGNVTLETGRLSIRDGAQISASTSGTGAGGILAVNAKDSVELSGTSTDGQFPSSLSTSAQPGATGTGGNLILETGRLSVRNGAQIGAATFGRGSAGTLAINAKDSVELVGTSTDGQFPSSLSTSVEQGATGTGGSVTLETARLSVRDGAQVRASTFGRGSAGTLAINAKDSVELVGTSTDGRVPSSLSTSVEQGATGAGGNLALETGRLSVRDGAQISASTSGEGSAGTLAVNALEAVELVGTSTDGKSSSGLFTSAQPGATGAGGNLIIETGRLSVQDGAQIGVSTFGKGSAGTLVVNAKESVELSGTSADGQRPSLLTARTRGAGNAGNLRIETGQLSVRNRAQIAVSSEGLGSAGQLEITARSMRLDQQATLTATTRSGNGGNIKLRAHDLILMRRGSEISTTAGLAGTGGDGGNIDIDTNFLAAVSSENSDITANAFTGRGGRVSVKVQGIFGIQPRLRLTPLNDITATSEAGPQLNGTVQINTLTTDPSQGLVVFPVVPVDVSGLVAQDCSGGFGNVGRGESEFIITGRGGLPPSPREPLAPESLMVDRSGLEARLENRRAEVVSTAATESTSEIVEAQGWVINDKGEVVLTAQTNTIPNAGTSTSTVTCYGH